MSLEFKTHKTGKSIATVIPKTVCNYMGIEFGDRLEVEILDKEKMVVRVKKTGLTK